MKSYLWVSALVLLPSLSFAKSYPCQGMSGSYHTNPDSSVGGFVASTAHVDSTVTITEDAAVCERATVSGNAIISDRAEISGRSSVDGEVIVSGKARVYGEAYLTNPTGEAMLVTDDAKIYGFAFLQGSVVVTGTSEIYGWGKVLDFAQIHGNSKICGAGIAHKFDVLQDDQTKCAQ